MNFWKPVGFRKVLKMSRIWAIITKRIVFANGFKIIITAACKDDWFKRVKVWY